MPMPDINDLIGVRFLDHGRDKEHGFDCYGLAIEVSRRYGHILPDLWYEHGDAPTFNKHAGDVIKELSGSVEHTDQQDEGNIVIFFDGNRMVHIGVILEDDMFIHCDKYGVRIQRLSEYYRRKWALYKWKD